ncbi:uncharacterized protein METZ01_LOCUS266037, partial [marine metagenome]
AGQLGQMLGYAGKHLDLDFVFLDPSDNPPAVSAGAVLKYDFDNPEGLEKLASISDVITYEFENVPVAALQKLDSAISVYPPAEALRLAQDRLDEKTLFQSLSIPVPGFRKVDSVMDLEEAALELGLPIVLKTRRLGYDGKGQNIVNDIRDIETAACNLGPDSLIAEQWVPFDREVSAIGSRNVSGQRAFYPVTENLHCKGILRESRAPADLGGLERIANEYLDRLLTHLNYVGVLALELFVVGDKLLANEFAPRVHNSGHWTIEGSATSQFENHLRAILDLAPGDTTLRGAAGMLNIIGAMPAEKQLFQAPSVNLHNYGKEARAGRKLGHVTIVAKDSTARDIQLEQLAQYLTY